MTYRTHKELNRIGIIQRHDPNASHIDAYVQTSDLKWWVNKFGMWLETWDPGFSRKAEGK